MSSIATKLTKLLGIKTPLISAPMYFATTPQMVAEVARAGGFGILPAGFDKTEQIIAGINHVRKATSTPYPKPAPLGIGFIGWILEITEADQSSEPRLFQVLDQNPKAIWLAFDDNLGKWVKRIKNYEESKGKVEEHRALIFVMVNTVDDALKAVNEWKVDVLVVQSYEAGGHGPKEALPLFQLLPHIGSKLPSSPSGGNAHETLVIGAGGISTGSQCASILSLGAHGCTIGTRLLCTTESLYSANDQIRRILINASFHDTTRSEAFDEVNGIPVNWPESINGRAVANDIMFDYWKGLSMEERMRKFKDGEIKKEGNRLVVWAGIGLEWIERVENTKEVIEQLDREMVEALEKTSGLLHQRALPHKAAKL